MLRVVDRKKDMIKTGGENVASREAEEVLYRHSGVQEVAVSGLTDPVWVEAVVAAVVPRDEVTLTEEDLLIHCRKHLAGFKTPKRVLFVASLPKIPAANCSSVRCVTSSASNRPAIVESDDRPTQRGVPLTGHQSGYRCQSGVDWLP